MVSPKLAITAGSSQRMSLGPAMATEGETSTVPSIAERADGAGALSCPSSQSHSSSTAWGAETCSA